MAFGVHANRATQAIGRTCAASPDLHARMASQAAEHADAGEVLRMASLPLHSWAQATAARAPKNTSAGIARCSFHVIATGRSPSCDT